MKQKKDKFLTLLTIIFLVFTFIGCSNAEEQPAEKTGTVIFAANGEDFIRDGFISEDGWDIQFSNFYVNVAGITAFQLEESSISAQKVSNQNFSFERELGPSFHAGHDHAGIPSAGKHVTLSGVHFIDLKNNLNSDGMVTLGSLSGGIGNYNRLNFRLAKIETGVNGIAASYVGNNIIIIGSATRADGSFTDTVNFTLKFNMDISYSACGPNGNAGVLSEGSSARAELTFHSDHIFGDQADGGSDTNPDDVNFVAIGFNPFARHSSVGILNNAANTVSYTFDQSVDIPSFIAASGNSNAIYVQLVNAVKTIGHSGEGHCSQN